MLERRDCERRDEACELRVEAAERATHAQVIGRAPVTGCVAISNDRPLEGHLW